MDANNATAALPLSGKRVMVLEDDVFVKMGLESTLLEAGAQIGTLAHLRTVDAAILDVRLGDAFNSFNIACELDRRSVPFLFYTGQSAQNLRALRSEWPRCKIIAKPAEPTAIVEAVVDLLHGK